jgi:hypothetical protein
VGAAVETSSTSHQYAAQAPPEGRGAWRTEGALDVTARWRAYLATSVRRSKVRFLYIENDRSFRILASWLLDRVAERWERPWQASVATRIEHHGLADMEDVVAVRVKLTSGRARYFLTWGRVPETLDPNLLLVLVGRNLHRFDLGGAPAVVELCPTLQDASNEPYFHEALFRMGQQQIPVGPGYSAWQKRVLLGLEDGTELYYLGRRRWRGKSVGKLNLVKPAQRRPAGR